MAAEAAAAETAAAETAAAETAAAVAAVARVAVARGVATTAPLQRVGKGREMEVDDWAVGDRWRRRLAARGEGGGGGGEGGGGEGGGLGGGEGGGGEGGGKKRGPQSVQSVPKMHCAGVPYKAVRDPGPPSWQTPLPAKGHELSHAIGGGGEGGGGEGGGDGDGGGGDGGYLKRAPQSVQSVPRAH